jgi:nucleotidyltransferase/DNA polymerase involved in DNA repair
MLICVVIRDFTAKYEEMLQPDLKSFPLLIYKQSGNKRTVYAMCEKARQLGVMPGMTKSQARGLCPEENEVDAHFKAYQRQASPSVKRY